MKKRIAMISYHTCPLASAEGKETGGMNVYVLELAKKLSQKGFLIDIFTRSQDKEQDHIVTMNKSLRVIHIKAGPETYFLPNTPENKRKFLDYIPEFAANILAFAQKENITYDLLDCHYYLSGLAGIAIKKQLSHLPMLMTFQTLALIKNLVARGELDQEEKERIEAEFILKDAADRIIIPSKNDEKYVHYLYDVPSNKIVTIPPGIDTKLFRPIDKTAAKKHIGAVAAHRLIIFVGRVDPIKGLTGLLYALKIMKQTYPECKICLWIVGGDTSTASHLRSKELQKLDQLRHILNLDTSVKFIEQQPQRELPYYYNAAELVVMPSDYESFGLTALEAIACGAPVIVSNVAGISGMFSETHQKLLTTANNPLLLAKQMSHLLKNPVQHRLLENIAEMDWDNVANKVISVYNDLV